MNMALKARTGRLLARCHAALGEHTLCTAALDAALAGTREGLLLYSEALTDTQWLKLVDGGADHEEIAVADRQKRRRRASNGNGA